MKNSRIGAGVPAAPETKVVKPDCRGLSETTMPSAPKASMRWSKPKAQRRELRIVAIVPSAVSNVTLAVSMSPRRPISGSTIELPCAVRLTGSCPRIERAMSKSWIIMSRNSPPERGMYSSGGGYGSRLVIVSCSSRPIFPALTASRTLAWPRS